MKRLSRLLASFLERRRVITPQSRPIYEYGFETILHTVFSTLGLLCIGACCGRPFETVVFITVFYTCQSLGGGYHASTRWGCFLTMSVLLGLYLAAFRLPYSLAGCVAAALTGGAILIGIPLVLHQNKRHLARKARVLAKRSRLASAALGCIFLLFCLLDCRLGIQGVSYSMAASSISRLTAHILVIRDAALG